MDQVPILFDLIYEFVARFFLGVHCQDTQIVYLVTAALTCAFFYGVIIRPVMWLLGFRRRRTA